MSNQFVPKHGAIEIIDPNDRGLPADLLYTAMSNKTLAEEVRKLIYANKDRWKMNGPEWGVLFEVYERLKSWS